MAATADYDQAAFETDILAFTKTRLIDRAKEELAKYSAVVESNGSTARDLAIAGMTISIIAERLLEYIEDPRKAARLPPTTATENDDNG